MSRMLERNRRLVDPAIIPTLSKEEDVEYNRLLIKN